MKEKVTYIDTKGAKIINLYTDREGQYIAFTNQNTVLTNRKEVKIDIKLAFSIVRKLNENTFLLVHRRTEKTENAFIFDFKGNKITSFLAGDGIEDVLIQNNKIVVSYFDEALGGGNGPNQDGVAVFNFAGKQLFGFNSAIHSSFIVDCYCICPFQTDKILFYIYDDFKVNELNLKTFEVAQFDTPIDFRGATAISAKEDKIYFHSSYLYNTSFFLWDRTSNQVTKFEKYSPKLTGIGKGLFFAYGYHGFTIIDPTQ